MRTWKELGIEFKALSNQMHGVRLDFQWGAAGDHWHLAGGFTPDIKTTFFTLSQFAGQKVSSLPLDPELYHIKAAKDPTIRWFEALRYISGAFEYDFSATQRDEMGNSLGNIYAGSVKNISEVSSNLCLKCEFLETSTTHTAILTLLNKPGLEGAAEHWRKVELSLEAEGHELSFAAGEAIKSVEGVARSTLESRQLHLAIASKKCGIEGP